MGLFDKGVDPADFDRFRIWVSEQVTALDRKITASASESAAESAAALASVKERKAQLDAMLEELESAHGSIKGAISSLAADLQEISDTRSAYLQDAEFLKSRGIDSLALHESIEKANSSTLSSVQSVKDRLIEIEDLLAQASRIPAELQTLEKLGTEAHAQNENIKSLLTHSLRRKNELDELHRAVFGHDIEDAEGNTERVDGLRDELKKAYDDLAARISTLDDQAKEAIQKVDEKQTVARREQNEAFDAVLQTGKASIDDVTGQLKALLPGALAAGLSAAYEKKKDEECASLSSHERNFQVAVLGLVAVSIIPFFVDVYLLSNGVPLATVLKDTPQLIVSILPLYFPVLWLAYSANKRLNLSKRLIEEYTHKAVLGKTFSGLSNQIETLPHESAVKDELRTRLLFNVLQVSAENPGKLITDYSKADHPIMDVLEKSARLSESVDALSKIPGLSALAKKLARRRDDIVRNQEAKVEDGIAANNALEAKPPGQAA